MSVFHRSELARIELHWVPTVQKPDHVKLLWWAYSTHSCTSSHGLPRTLDGYKIKAFQVLTLGLISLIWMLCGPC